MDEEEDADIAAAMGFGSFGGTKKRKHDQTNSPKSKPDASGANSTQRGVRPKKQATDEYTTKEISHNTSASSDGVLPISKLKQQTTKGTGLAAFLARGHALPEQSTQTQPVDAPGPQSKADAGETVSFGGAAVSRAELNALRFGVKNEAGDVAYFQPSFLEDPWEKLEANFK